MHEDEEEDEEDESPQASPSQSPPLLPMFAVNPDSYSTEATVLKEETEETKSTKQKVLSFGVDFLLGNSKSQ